MVARAPRQTWPRNAAQTHLTPHPPRLLLCVCQISLRKRSPCKHTAGLWGAFLSHGSSALCQAWRRVGGCVGVHGEQRQIRLCRPYMYMLRVVKQRPKHGRADLSMWRCRFWQARGLFFACPGAGRRGQVDGHGARSTRVRSTRGGIGTGRLRPARAQAKHIMSVFAPHFAERPHARTRAAGGQAGRPRPLTRDF